MLRRRYSLLIYDEMFYRYLLNLFRPLLVSFTVSLFSYCFNDLSSDESGVLKCPTIIVVGAVCVFSFSKVSL